MSVSRRRKKNLYDFSGSSSKINQIKVSQVEIDQFTIIGHTVYLHCLSYGKTKLNNHFFENKLKVIATTRNFRTVNKLYALAK